MVLEEQILPYYLKVSSLSLIIFILYLCYIINFKAILNEDKVVKIERGLSSNEIIKSLNIKKNLFDERIFLIILKFSNTIHYGEFSFEKNSSFIDILKIISKPSNVDYQLTIVEGWEKYQLKNYMNYYFNDYRETEYNNILADTYIIKSGNKYLKLLEIMKVYKQELTNKYKDNELLKKYTMNEILIISSLVEKEGKSIKDKKMISSVIFNRLNKNMKLQIDATVIYSLTKGRKIFKRNLTYNDLKINHPFNTYVIRGLPPSPICYVGIKTIEIVLENYKTNYLFYFYNTIEKKHIFSINYNEHKANLYEYRKKIK